MVQGRLAASAALAHLHRPCCSRPLYSTAVLNSCSRQLLAAASTQGLLSLYSSDSCTDVLYPVLIGVACCNCCCQCWTHLVLCVYGLDHCLQHLQVGALKGGQVTLPDCSTHPHTAAHHLLCYTMALLSRMLLLLPLLPCTAVACQWIRTRLEQSLL